MQYQGYRNQQEDGIECHRPARLQHLHALRCRSAPEEGVRDPRYETYMYDSINEHVPLRISLTHKTRGPKEDYESE